MKFLDGAGSITVVSVAKNRLPDSTVPVEPESFRIPTVAPVKVLVETVLLLPWMKTAASSLLLTLLPLAVLPLPTRAMPSSATEWKIVLEPTTALLAATKMPT